MNVLSAARRRGSQPSEEEARAPGPASNTPAPFARFAPFAAVAVIFVASRAAYYAAGVRFDARPLDYFAQYIDPPLLRDRLGESLLFLHAQPPLYNLAGGLALKLGAGDAGLLLWALHLGIGIAWFAVTMRFLTRLGMGSAGAIIVAGLFHVSPTLVLFENIFFYPYAVAFLLVLAAYCLLRSTARVNGWLALAFSAIAGAALIRSVYPPAYCVAALGLAAAFVLRESPRRFFVYAGVPIALVLAWALKNAILFGFFGTSSWGGNSLHKQIARSMRAEIPMLVADGTLHPISALWEFSPPADFVHVLGEGSAGDTGVPALDQLKEASEAYGSLPNYNHWSYPLASKLLMRDALRLIARAPRAYAGVVWSAFQKFLLVPSSDDPILHENRRTIADAAALCDLLENGKVELLAFVAALIAWARASRAGAMPQAQMLSWAFSFGTMIWVAAVTSAVEFGENNRMRFEILGIAYVFVSSGLWALVRHARGAPRP